MYMLKQRLTAIATLVVSFYVNAEKVNPSSIEEVNVFANAFFKDTTLVSPSSKLSTDELGIINITTVEDILAHEPSLVIRKRFIGDPNGVLGIRGSNMFQTPRTMVFLDGMPLHFHLRTRFNGSPRWSLASPDEVETAEVIYGPYSSEYSGNAIGGVVNFKSRRPQQQRITFEAGYFAQEYDQLNTDETYDGYRTYLAYENKFNNLGVIFSYTRLDNESQPQTQFFQTPGSDTSTATAVSGGIAGRNEVGAEGIFFGDSGSEQAETDLFKTKFFYEHDNFEIRASIAYEERSRIENERNNFLRDNSDELIFDREVDINGQNIDTFEFGRSLFQNRAQERESLLLGLGASFNLQNDWVGDVFYSFFDIIKDEEIRTGANPSDAQFAAVNNNFDGRLTDFDDTGWNIVDAKFSNDNLGSNDNQRLSFGFHFDSYELNLIVDNFNSITGQSESPDTRDDSGGKAETYSVFAQYGIALNDQWDLSLGIRYDDWDGTDGFEGDSLAPNRSEHGFSPKLSIAYFSSARDTFRYSAARALRFPVIEEIFVNNADTGGGSVGDASLEPEDGIFHNLSYIREFKSGSLTINLFYDEVEDAIFNQTDTMTNITTFLPIDEVRTQGAELIINKIDFADLPLDIRFNVSYTDTEITKNTRNPSVEGNDFPRIPEWRANLISTYNVTQNFDIGGSIRYASDSFGELDNSDTEDNVFGAIDDYIFVGLKSNWQATKQLTLSAGIDNIFNEEAFVRHPWPGRTYHINAKYVIGK